MALSVCVFRDPRTITVVSISPVEVCFGAFDALAAQHDLSLGFKVASNLAKSHGRLATGFCAGWQQGAMINAGT